eukprot:scaffold112375_cov69-Phaeocystis_antarctica.AAC.6
MALPAGLGQSLPAGRLPKVGWWQRRRPSAQSKPVVWAASVVRGRRRPRRLARGRAGRVLLPRRARRVAASPCVGAPSAKVAVEADDAPLCWD